MSLRALKYTAAKDGPAAILLIALSLTLLINPGNAQEAQDSVVTPFRKARWLLGLSGTISSGSVRSDTASAAGFNAEYSLNISGSRFVRDRLAVGGLFRGDRAAPLRVDRQTESLFIGPVITYYFSDSPIGSLFVQGSPGYTRFLEERTIDTDNALVNESIIGQGVGVFLTLGYSIVIKDIVGFDLGFSFLNSWIWADKVRDPPLLETKENFRVGDYAFSFGFRILL